MRSDLASFERVAVRRGTARSLSVCASVGGSGVRGRGAPRAGCYAGGVLRGRGATRAGCYAGGVLRGPRHRFAAFCSDLVLIF